MEEFLNNYANNRMRCLNFLRRKFNNAYFTQSDYEDITSNAVEKILAKPNLSKNLNTLIYIANLCAIDLFRKRQRETLVADFPNNTLPVFWGDETDLEQKELTEAVIREIELLCPRHQALMSIKFHACPFESTVSNDLIIAFKNQPRLSSEQLANRLAYPSANAVRQDTFRAVSQLKMRLLASI